MAMNKRKALGRGVAVLIPTGTEDSRDDEIQLVDLNAIDPNPYQPRLDFDESEIAELAESIKNQGLLQPVVLRKAGSRYQIVSGERRCRAFRHLRRDSVPCIVKPKVTDDEMLELALVENIQRAQLNEIETAIAYRKLAERCNYTHDQLAKRVGKSRAAVTNSLRLLSLPEEIQQMVRVGVITMGHARALLSLTGADRQLDAARSIVSGNLTVRDIERITQTGKAGSLAEEPGKADAKTTAKAKRPQTLHADTADVLERLQYKFGAPVKLKEASGGKGKIEIEYFSVEDLTRVFDILLGGN